MFDLSKIISHKVVAIKGEIFDSGVHKYIEPVFILFDTDEFFIKLEEQDYYDYHDCSTSARSIEVINVLDYNRDYYNNIKTNKDNHFPNANFDI